MRVCSVSGCENTGENSAETFFPFPADFDLYMRWIQACGKADYFEDFAYSGALPFIEQAVCSRHFETTDFIDPNNKSLGLKNEVIPLGESDIVIKEEALDTGDLHYAPFDDEDSTEFEETGIKTEPYRDNYFLREHDYFSGNSSDELNHSILPLLVIAREKLIWKKKPVSLHNTFGLTWSQALKNVEARATMYKKPTEENTRRPENIIHKTGESEQAKKDRLHRNAVRVALKRSLETKEQKQERRLKNALRAAYRRSVETPEQRAERRKKDLLRSARRRQEETELQAQIRKYNDAVRAAFRRRNETPEQRAQRKMIDVLRAARRRSMETAEQKEARLKADRERAARKRFFNKLKIFEQEEPQNCTEARYYNLDLKIMKNESEEFGSDFVDVRQSSRILEDVDVIFSMKANRLGEQGKSKITQAVCTYTKPQI